jgi:hypothetical protein
VKLAVKYSVAKSPNHLAFDVYCDLSPHDERVLKPIGGSFTVNFSRVPLVLDLFDARLERCELPNVPVKAVISVGKKFEFSSVWNWTSYLACDHRLGIEMAHRVMHEIEYAMIAAAPQPQFTGAIRTFDVEVDVPKSMLYYESLRRNIITRA